MAVWDQLYHHANPGRKMPMILKVKKQKASYERTSEFNCFKIISGTTEGPKEALKNLDIVKVHNEST